MAVRAVGYDADFIVFESAAFEGGYGEEIRSRGWKDSYRWEGRWVCHFLKWEVEEIVG